MLNSRVAVVPGGTAVSQRDAAAPVRTGPVPPLADCFASRPETAPGLAEALVPGAAVVLVPGRPAADGTGTWPGSCGTTQLAAGAAESLWASGELDLLVWVTATSRAAVLSAYARAAAVTAVTGTSPAGDTGLAATRFARWLSHTSRRCLVVLDDLSDPADLEGLWPESPAGRVLITTARAGGLAADRGALVLPVGVLSRREAMSFLMARLTADPDQRLGAIDLVGELGGEPLALAQASAAIVTSGMACRDYQEHFQRRREQFAAAAGGVPPPAAAVTWTFCAEEADRLAPGGDAQALLILAALLDGHTIPAQIFTTPAVSRYLAADAASPASPERAGAALRVLDRVGLLAVGPGESGETTVVRVSAAVQAAVRAAAPATMLERAARTAADALAQAWPASEPRPWDAAILRACTASLLQAAGDQLWDRGCPAVALRAGQSLHTARLTGPALAHWNDLIQASGRILGRGHPDTLTISGHLAAACLAAGRAPEAAAWTRWALDGLARDHGPDHPAVITARRDLGRALTAAGQHDHAVTVLTGAAADSARVLGASHPDTLGAQDDLAAAYRAAGRHSDAIRLYRHTLTARERAQGPRHPDTMSTRQKLADTCMADRRARQAITAYKRVLADREAVLGPDHPDTITALGNLGAAFHAAGRMAAAIEVSEQACAASERILGTDHPDTLARRVNLARACHAAGRLTDAVTLLRDTAAHCEQILSPGDPLTGAARESLANITGEPRPDSGAGKGIPGGPGA